MKKLLLLFISALLAVSVQAQSNDKPGNWKLIVSDEYPADDVGVATYTVTTDFNADPTGVQDSRNAFQTALDILGENRRGGTCRTLPYLREVIHPFWSYYAWRMETSGKRTTY